MATNKRKRAPAEDEPSPVLRVLRPRRAAAEPIPARAHHPSTVAASQPTKTTATKPLKTKKAKNGKKGKAAPGRAAPVATQCLEQASTGVANAEDTNAAAAAIEGSATGSDVPDQPAVAPAHSMLATQPASPPRPIATSPAPDRGQSPNPPPTRPTRTYPRARPRKPDDRPATEDEYFMKRVPSAAPAATQRGSVADMSPSRVPLPAVSMGPIDTASNITTPTCEDHLMLYPRFK
ncbi:hypothetical protein K525DRAFT_275346 [Schizophyllum commune Loenen D]|nr:hypothetical protein K525DRAFT_275346 [Schizophyllum commune Loenen D]